MTPEAIERIQTEKNSLRGFENQFEKKIDVARRFYKVFSNQKMLTEQDRNFIMASTGIEKLKITAHRVDAIDNQLIAERFILPLREIEGQVFNHQWQLEDAWAEKSVYGRQKKNDKDHNAYPGPGLSAW